MEHLWGKIHRNFREMEEAEMLGGEFRHSLDSKNRIFVPAKLRDELGASFIIAKDIREKCLKAYSLAGWEKYTAPLREQNRRLSEKILR